MRREVTDKKMRSDKKLALNRLTPELLLPSVQQQQPLAWSSVPSTPSLTPGSRASSPKEQHHTDDFLRSTMKLFLLVTPPAAKMQVWRRLVPTSHPPTASAPADTRVDRLQIRVPDRRDVTRRHSTFFTGSVPLFCASLPVRPAVFLLRSPHFPSKRPISLIPALPFTKLALDAGCATHRGKRWLADGGECDLVRRLTTA